MHAVTPHRVILRRARPARAVLLLVTLAAATPVVLAEYYGPPGAPPPQPEQGYYGQPPTLPPLQQMLAPIALYPDPLLAIVFPAATEPGQIQQAAGFIDSGGPPDQIAYQPWDESVKALAHYPDLTRWLAQNIGWTQQVGGAFATDRDRVMDAVQDLRRRALGNGVLRSTPQEAVYDEDGVVRIVPNQPDVVYIPRYNPYTVFYPGAPDAYIDWGAPVPTGPWLMYYPSWRQHSIWVGNWWQRSQREHGWHFNIGNLGISVGGIGDHEREEHEEHEEREHEWRIHPDSPVRRNEFHFDFRGHERYEPQRPMPGTPGERYWGHPWQGRGGYEQRSQPQYQNQPRQNHGNEGNNIQGHYQPDQSH